MFITREVVVLRRPSAIVVPVFIMIIQQYFCSAHGNHGNVIDLDRVFRWRHQMFDLHLTSFVRLLCRPCAKPRICNHPQVWITAVKTCNSITFSSVNYKVFAAFTLACFAKRLILFVWHHWREPGCGDVTKMTNFEALQSEIRTRFMRRNPTATPLQLYSICNPRFWGKNSRKMNLLTNLETSSFAANLSQQFSVSFQIFVCS